MENNKKSIIKAGLGYTVGNYLIKGINFLTIPVFTRILSTSDYGIYNTYLAYEGILFLICGLGLHASVKKAKYNFGEEFDEYNSSIMVLSLFNLFVLLCIFTAFSSWIGIKLSLSPSLLIVLLFHSFGSYLLLYFNDYLSLYYQYKRYILVSGFNAGLNVALSIVLILYVFPSQRSTGRILGTAIPVLITGIYIVGFIFSRFSPTIKLEYWKYALSYSLPIIPHGLSQLILNQADRVMITEMIGTSETGIYSFAYTIYTVVMVTSTSLNNVWTTWFYEKLGEKSYKEIKNRSSEYTEIFAIFVTSILFISIEVVRIIADSSYWDSIYCVVPIIISGFFWFMYTLQVSVEYYYEKTIIIAAGSIIVAVLNIILNYYFIPMYGYIAAAYTTLVSYMLYAIVHTLIARFIVHRSLFDKKTSILMSLMVCAAGAVTIICIDYWIIRYACLIFIFYFYRKKIRTVVYIMKGKAL